MLALSMTIAIIVAKKLSNTKTHSRKSTKRQWRRGRYHDRAHRWCPSMWRGRRCPNFGHTPTTHRGRGPFPLDTMVRVGSKKSFCARRVSALVWFLRRNTKRGQLPQKYSLN